MTQHRSLELLGRELARQIHLLAALKDDRKEKLKDFAAREQAIVKEIARLALDVRTGQTTFDLTETSHQEGDHAQS